MKEMFQTVRSPRWILSADVFCLAHTVFKTNLKYLPHFKIGEFLQNSEEIHLLLKNQKIYPSLAHMLEWQKSAETN